MRPLRQLFSLIIFLCLCCVTAKAQSSFDKFCGGTTMMEKWLQNPVNKSIHEQIEQQVLVFKTSGALLNRTNSVVTLPVVVHIIHNNGNENISDAQVLQGIQHLNQAFANLAPYDPNDGVDCQVQFCLAKRDPNGNATNGITRNVSTLTNLNMDTDDINLKNLNRWNPQCYINIWLVNEICSNSGCGVAGYAYLPGAHGSNVDGIVQEAGYFGSSSGNSGVQIHEMGHYLGLYHTFQGGCTNNNCLTDGDRICDTPPDQATTYLACGQQMNSCSTDALSGFTSDQNDLVRDYMDYGNLDCYSIFTQGQADRMNWHIINVRGSLLNCMSCLDPCLAPVTANFTTPGATVLSGSSYTFTNTSANAATYEWYVNNVLVSTATNFSYTFPAIGTYIIKLVAKSSGNLCIDGVKTVTINAICPVTTGFTKSAAVAPCGTNISFTNTSSGANSYEWFVNNVSQTTSVNFSYTNSVASRYAIKLVAKNAANNCTREFIDTVEYTCPVTAAFTPDAGGITPINTSITFTNTSTGATGYQWLVNGAVISTSTNFAYSFTTPGNYSVLLLASNGICSSSKIVYYTATDTCNRSAFQKLYGMQNAVELINDVISTPDGGFISCGQSSTTPGGQQDAWVVKYNNEGNIQWSKAYGGVGLDWFRSIKKISSGGYIAAGSTSSFGGMFSSLVMRLDDNGNVIWAKRYGENTGVGVGDQAYEVIQTASGFFICGIQSQPTQGFKIVLLNLDNNGDLQWGRVYNSNIPFPYDLAASVIEENSSYTVTGTTLTNNPNNVYLYLMKVNKTDGSIITAYGYDADNNRSENAYQLTKTGNNYELAYNVYPFGTAPQPVVGIMRINESGGVLQSKYLNTGQRDARGFFKPAPDGGYLAGVVDVLTSTFQMYKFGPFFNQQWGNRYTHPDQSLNVTNINLSADGGYLAAGQSVSNPSGIQNALLLKTDVAGNTPGCTNTPSTAILGDVVVTPAPVSFTSRAYNPANNPTFNLAATDRPVPVTSLCSGTSCEELEDTCSMITFQKSLGTPTDDVITDVKNTPDGGYIAVGTTQVAVTSSDGQVIRLDSKGELLWHTALSTNNSDQLQRVINTADGGYLAAGYIAPIGAPPFGWMVKLDASGNMQWSRRYTDGNSSGSAIWDVCQTSDGGYAFAGVNRYVPTLADAMVGKTDANGNIQWCKSFSGASSDQAWGILEANGQLIVSAFGVNLGGGPFYDGVFMKLNMANGSVIFARSYDIESRSNWFLRINKMSGGRYLIDCNNTNDYTVSAYTYINLVIDSASGQVSYMVRNNAPAERSGAGAVAVTSDGGFMVTQSELNNADVHFRKNSATGALQTMKKYGTTTASEVMYSIVETPDKGIFGGGYKTGPSGRDFFFIKTGPNGSQEGSCPVVPDVGDNSTPAFNTNVFTWPTINNVNILPNTSSGHVVTQYTLTPVTQCANINKCDSLDVTGADSICRMQDTITYTAKRGPGCGIPILWTVTPAANAQVIATTDSTIKIKFLLPGYVRVRGVIINSCAQALEDTLGITVFSTPMLNLGPDIALCSNSTMSLHAGPGFKTYRWQDGFTDSIYTAYQPGTYWVQTEDFCGNIFRDTMLISIAPPVPFNLGPDLLRCNDDTLTITAPAGFSNYTWAANYNINSVNGRTVKVWPTVDTLYAVVAERSPGCQVYDTIRVTVARSPIISLGNDTTFCAGGNITLNAGTGFTGYIWSTGAITPTLNVNATGTYWVEGTTARGCKSRDTLRVNIFAAPNINIGADTSICQGNTLVLDAGPGFTNYLWQNGTTAQTLSATTAGLYWVEVRNNNGCRSRDSMRIINVHANAPVSIGNDTSFCAGGSVILNPHTGAGFSYLWQNGATTPTFTVTAAGLYWVEVQNGGTHCRSWDSMRVLNLYPLPNVNIGGDTILCVSNSITLNAGAGYTAYLWHDNSNGQTFTASTVGTYWVRVTSGNNCVASDTMRITAIGSTPFGFILPRTGMCAYEPIYVHGVTGYRNYLWSTGATADSALIARPGSYTLQVTTNDGCSATESFEVFDKKCPQEIYFPTAFTPNNDGLNDVYRPVLFGILKTYRLEIYNRYGERIFFTEDHSKGWDGTFKGKPQGAGTYIWKCQYQIKDKDAAFKKGTIVLVR